MFASLQGVLGQRSFEENVKPNLPEGVVPDRKYRKLHNFVPK